jgi:hypothetical protein
MTRFVCFQSDTGTRPAGRKHLHHALGVRLRRRAYMNGGLSSHQLPTKAIAHPSFFADLQCPLLAIADIPLGHLGSD